MRSYRKAFLIISFTGSTMREFDNVFDKEITKRYGKHERLQLSKRERERGAERPLKLDLKNRLNTFNISRFYIIYTLTVFLFDFD